MLLKQALGDGSSGALVLQGLDRECCRHGGVGNIGIHCVVVRKANLLNRVRSFEVIVLIVIIFEGYQGQRQSGQSRKR